MSLAFVRRPGLKPEEQLHNGDRMSRKEFHRLYEMTPEDFRAELIGGTVFLGSRVGLRHGTARPVLAAVLMQYEGNCPGVEGACNATVLLGETSEPQPDLLMRIRPEYGGQSRTTEDDYIEGPPELVVEIAYNSRSIDLHAKLEDYRRYCVLEYLVLDLADRRPHWFDLRSGRELTADGDGIVRVRCFPGLWIDVEALLTKEANRLFTTLQQGLATPEHRAFSRRLQDARRARQQAAP